MHSKMTQGGPSVHMYIHQAVFCSVCSLSRCQVVGQEGIEKAGGGLQHPPDRPRGFHLRRYGRRYLTFVAKAVLAKISAKKTPKIFSPTPGAYAKKTPKIFSPTPGTHANVRTYVRTYGRTYYGWTDGRTDVSTYVRMYYSTRKLFLSVSRPRAQHFCSI